MAQHDYDIANQSGANFRADLNNALDAIVSNNSGSSEPSTTFAYEWWIDTSANVLKLRNSANNAWITLPLSITADNSTSGALTVNGNLSTTGTLDVNGGEVILDADADTSITADTDDQIDFKIGNVDVATLTNSHLVLKGTTPKITIGDGGEEDTALIFDGNAQDFYIGLDDSADDLVIGKGSTVGTTPALSIDENLLSTFAGGVTVQGAFTSLGIDDNADATAINITSGEQVLIGSANTTNNLRLQESFAIVSTGNLGGMSITGYPSSISTYRPLIDIQRSRGASDQSMTKVESGDYLGSIVFRGADGTNFLDGAEISARADGATGTNDMPTNLTFHTQADGGSGASAERMRITSAGDVLVGKTSTAFGTAGMHLQGSSGRTLNTVNGDNVMDLNRLTSHGVILGFYLNSVSVGTISTNTHSLPSDRNFKRDITDLDLGLNLVTKLKPSQYNYKIDSEDSPKMYGLIAQDLEQALEDVGIEKNSAWLLQHESNDDEKQSDYSLDYTKLIPILINSIKELEERIKTLEE